MTKRTLSNLCIVTALVFTCNAGADAPAAPASKIMADFHMTRTLRALKDAVHSKGRLAMGGPGLLRWETTSPARSVLIVNQGKGWLHYPDLKVTKGFDVSADPVMKVLSEHLLALTSGNLSAVKDMYEVKAVDDHTRELTPKGGEIKKLFATMRVTTDDKGQVARVALVSRSGDTTTIDFSNVQKNPDIPVKAFEAPGKK